MSHLVWILAGLALLIAEIFISGYYLLGFGTSAILTGIIFPRQFSGPVWEIMACLAGGTLLFAIFRRIARDRVVEVEKGPEMQALVGRIGLVMERIIAWRAGVVEIDGKVWEAVSEERKPLLELGKVIVQAVRKNRLVVQATEDPDKK
jgi:membrane protein implicated in regulation of membrane protease activity